MRIERWISLPGLGLLALLSSGCGGGGTPGAETTPEQPADAGASIDGEDDAGATGPEGERLDPELQALLDDLAAAREPKEIAALARALGDHRHPASVNRLITLLASDQERIRNAAVDSIERIGEDAVEPMIAALDASDPVQRERVIDCLASIGDPRAIPALIRVLPVTAENQSAARALARFRKAAVPALLEALESGTGTTRVQAAWALEIMLCSDAIVEALLKALKDEYAPVRAQAAAALGTHGIAEAIGPISTLLDDPDLEVRMSAAAALVRIGTPEALEQFDRALADEAHEVRGEAVYHAGASWDPALLDRLYAAVGDEHHEVRKKAREAIRTIVTHKLKGTASDEIVQRLIGMLNDDNPAARASAAYLLGSLHAAKATKALARVLKDGDEDVRFAALSALRDLENPAAAQALIGALRDEDPQIRAGAAELLGMMEIERAARPLARLLRDPVAEVRRAAADALELLTKPSVVKPLVRALGDEDPSVADSAERALLAIGAPATRKLVAAFKKPKTGTSARLRIAGLLGHQWKANAFMALVGALKDPERMVAEKAHTTLVDMICVELGPDPADWREWWRENKRDEFGDCPSNNPKYKKFDPQEHPPIW